MFSRLYEPCKYSICGTWLNENRYRTATFAAEQNLELGVIGISDILTKYKFHVCKNAISYYTYSEQQPLRWLQQDSQLHYWLCTDTG